MTTNEIKKELYKQNPLASLVKIRKGIVYYETILTNTPIPIRYTAGVDSIKTNSVVIDRYLVNFEVPMDDMGDADFFETMSAKLLIRYLVVDDGDKEPIRRVDEIY